MTDPIGNLAFFSSMSELRAMSLTKTMPKELALFSCEAVSFFSGLDEGVRSGGGARIILVVPLEIVKGVTPELESEIIASQSKGPAPGGARPTTNGTETATGTSFARAHSL